MLVLVSFSLQVFLLLFSGIRKRITSKVLSILLWLAYLSADSLAVFVLGRLTLNINGGLRHGLVLFWAPFMLLHLGGQDTMTAFSMEDNMLWKRHLLNFATQVGLASNGRETTSSSWLPWCSCSSQGPSSMPAEYRHSGLLSNTQHMTVLLAGWHRNIHLMRNRAAVIRITIG